jgi:signal transduction histidine kinase/DNA-binding response OmpR family regulator
MTAKILIAEDDPEARELLLLLLGDKSYCLLEAADGVEALELVRSELPDLLITDIVMPRMDGYELVRRLRQDQMLAHMPVIFCSASYHQRDVRAMAHALGVIETIAKPYERSRVQSLIAEVVSGAERTVASVMPTSRADLDARQAHVMQDRLTAMVAFSRQLFSHTYAELIASAACRGAREILMAQCAQLSLRNASNTAVRSVEGGIADVELQQLLATPMFNDLLATVEDGGAAIYPMVPPAPAALTQSVAGGAFLSMLGVPVASGSQVYGYLCLVNRIGLTGFTEEDAGIARAIAAQVAVAHENSLRRQALEEQIAQRTTAEAEVRRLNQDLERRVVERTAELQIANRELEAFSYSVAHDLRAPLRLIDARAQMLTALLRTVRDESVGLLIEHAEDIRRGGARMNALIDGLLALSRVSHVEMHKERVSLSQLVAEARERVEPYDGQRIEWRIESLPAVRCDAELMRQVFVNLLDNAVKYSRRRVRSIIEIGIRVEQGEPALFVRDNGVGFDARYANKLFGVFQRLHHADEFEGTGIGLATVSRIIERHGGRIWAQADIGTGATFHFTLAGLTALAELALA